MSGESSSAQLMASLGHIVAASTSRLPKALSQDLLAKQNGDRYRGGKISLGKQRLHHKLKQLGPLHLR
jgi:hypothetical protein